MLTYLFRGRIVLIRSRSKHRRLITISYQVIVEILSSTVLRFCLTGQIYIVPLRYPQFYTHLFCSFIYSETLFMVIIVIIISSSIIVFYSYVQGVCLVTWIRRDSLCIRDSGQGYEGVMFQIRVIVYTFVVSLLYVKRVLIELLITVSPPRSYVNHTDILIFILLYL